MFVRLYTDPVLKKSCQPITEIDNALLDTITQMLVCMKTNRGIGLSANQVGIDKTFCVVSLNNNTTPLAIINPKLTWVSKKKETMGEGCLSIPGLYVPMKRHKEIIIDCLDMQGQACTYKLTDLDARILQHEMDHLNGKCIVDFIPKIQEIKK